MGRIKYVKPYWIKHQSDMPAERSAYRPVPGNNNEWEVRPDMQGTMFLTLENLPASADPRRFRRWHAYYAYSAALRRARRIARLTVRLQSATPTPAALPRFSWNYASAVAAR